MKDPLYRARSAMMLRGVRWQNDMTFFRLCSYYLYEQELDFYKTRAIIMSSTGDANLISKTFREYAEKVFPKEHQREEFIKESRSILAEEEGKTYSVKRIIGGDN